MVPHREARASQRDDTPPVARTGNHAGGAQPAHNIGPWRQRVDPGILNRVIFRRKLCEVRPTAPSSPRPEAWVAAVTRKHGRRLASRHRRSLPATASPSEPGTNAQNAILPILVKSPGRGRFNNSLSVIPIIRHFPDPRSLVWPSLLLGLLSPPPDLLISRRPRDLGSPEVRRGDGVGFTLSPLGGPTVVDDLVFRATPRNLRAEANAQWQGAVVVA